MNSRLPRASSRRRRTAVKNLLLRLHLLTFPFVLQIALAAWPVDSASGQDWAEDILNQVKRAQKLIQGERPCDTRIEVKGEEWRVVADGIDGRIVRALPAGAEPGVTLHLIRLDPKKISVRVLLSKDLGTESATAESFATRSDVPP